MAGFGTNPWDSSSKKKSADPLATVLKANASSRAKLAAMGQPDPTQKPNPSALERIFGILDTPGAGIRSVFHNLVDTRQQVNPLEEMGKALGGAKRVEGADILSDLGVKDKWGQLLGGIAIDIALDPLTYLGGGFKSITKAESASQLGKMAFEGLDVAKLVDYGVDANKYLDKADDAGRILATMLDTADSRKIAEVVRKTVGATLGDYGGIKFMGQTILPVEGSLEKGTYLLKDLLNKLPASEWFQKAFLYGDELTPLMRQGNEVVNAGVRKAQKVLQGGLAVARKEGADMAKILMEEIPDPTIRSLVTFGIGRQFGSYVEQGALRTAGEAVKSLEYQIKAAKSFGRFDDIPALLTKLEDAKVAVREEMSKLVFDPEAVAKTLRAAGITDEATIAKAVDATAKMQSKLDTLIAERGANGLPNWTLYQGVEGAPKSAGYTIGMKPMQETRKSADAAQDAASRLGLTFEGGAPVGLQNLADEPRAGATLFDYVSRKKPTAYKSKEYVNAEQRIVEGGLATETDIAKLAGAKTMKDYGDIALADFQSNVGKMFGGEVPEEAKKFVSSVERVFTNDEAMRGLLKAYDKTLNLWKRMATIYNFPMFSNRNFISNKFLQFTENVLDPAAEARSFELLGKEMRGTLSAKEADEMMRLRELGVLTSAKDLAEQVGGGVFARGGITSKLAQVNEFAENQSRVAAYFAAKAKGVSDEAAAMIVDRALYNYSPEMLTSFERNFMRRVVPFYVFARRNTPHMFQVLFESPGKLTWISHAKESGEAATGVTSDQMPDYMRNLFAIPLPNGQVLSTGGVLPIQDLERVMPQDPMEMLREQITSLSPLIRDPIEFLTNKDIYRDTAIESYPGEKRAAPDYVQTFDTLMAGNPAWEELKKQLGMVYKTRSDGQQYLTMNASAAKALKDFLPFMSAIARGAAVNEPSKQFSQATGIKLVPTDTKEWARQKAYDEQSTLLDTLRRLKDEGKVPPVAKKKTTSLAEVLRGRK